jgi:MarR family transcriptional regulator, 2-MHQ and catechol-resistance regulon repressor
VADHVFDDQRLTAMGLLAETYGGLTARITDQLAEHDLSGVEFETLLRLARSPEHQLRMTDLANQTQLTTSGVTRVVDRLERDQLVCRSACPTDRRSSYAVITTAGLERLAAVIPGHIAVIDRWFTGRLTGTQLDRMLEGLRMVRDAVHPNATSGVGED